MIYVLYHENCMDGFAAAYAAWRLYGGDATYLPVNYNQLLPEMLNATSVYILDFSYPRETLISLSESLGGEILVLDHHKTAEADLQGLSFAKFDQTKSGAVLAWEYFHPNQTLPSLFEYIQDRDLWQWKLPGSKAVSAYLRLKIDFKSFEDFDDFVDCLTYDLADKGSIILEYEQQIIDRLFRQKHQMMYLYPKLNEILIWSVNSPILQSEIGNALALEHGLGDVYYDTTNKEGKLVRRHSLRSVNDLDVSVIAKQFGGGGHKNAAGFEELI